jgi:hypothetical protein
MKVGIYKHYKGKLYEVIGIVRHSETLEEMILRIMKKHNLGALDLTGSGGRLLYRRQTTKGALNVKSITEMLTQHLKSETAATEAIEFINKHLLIYGR